MANDAEFLRTPRKRPWRLKPTRNRNPISAVLYDAEWRLVAALAYGNAEMIVIAQQRGAPEIAEIARPEKRSGVQRGALKPNGQH